ncbi:MAG: hypothetical protein M1832_001204 [Thelocarpon impressellum]|nr:MAG: hypothetical protein M1832_001204 [Thelocarpon impressellum]
MAGLDHHLSGDGLIDVAFDPQDARYPYPPRTSWPLPMEPAMPQQHPPPPSHGHLHLGHGRRRNPSDPTPAATTATTTPPLHSAAHDFHALNDPSAGLLADWALPQAAHLPPYVQDASSLGPQFAGAFGGPFQSSPVDFLPSSQPQLDSSLGSFVPLAGNGETVQWNWDDMQNGLMSFVNNLSPSGLSPSNLPDGSPTDTYLEIQSLTSSGSDNGWATIDYQPFDGYRDAQHGAIFNPGETLHIRTNSESSQSDVFRQARSSFDSLEEISYPLPSPDSDVHVDHACRFHPGSVVSPSAAVEPVAIKASTSPRRSPSSRGASSPPSRRPSRKSPIAKATKPVIRRPPQPAKKDNEKRVGRRSGPLLPEQRKQASEIRKLRACLRCKFLKKTCDKGEPCAGCRPAHARLWQVPCTRIDIKDVAYFMKDYKADYERHVTRGFSVTNIRGYSSNERSLYITHGYGFLIHVSAREVYVHDEDCFAMDWVETLHAAPLEFKVATAKLSAGADGISRELLSEYLDQHIDGDFEGWVDQYFEGTPFLTEILKTAYRYYARDRLPVIHKALKLVLAYNLTQHFTMVEGLTEEEKLVGEIVEEESKFRGKTVAPVMINFQVKCALADMWRELQKEILEELSALYSSVYSGEKLKNWPTIFLLAAILLAVWEEMQFDCHYRVPDTNAVDKFCNDMETIPVGVIVGLFSAISQKLPAFNEWDTRKHHQLLNSNAAVCDAMTEVKGHVDRYEDYLKSRADAKFDRQDFDCLSNKFLSKLVIRAN